MADKKERVPVQEVPIPVVRALEFSGTATFTQGDDGDLAENQKFSDIRSAIEGVPGLENVKLEDLKAKSAEATQKEAEKDEKAQRKAEAKAREDEEAELAGETEVDNRGVVAEAKKATAAAKRKVS